MLPSLSDIFSQSRAVDFLRAALHENRLPHALIFAGPAGVGKRTTANALAATLLCLHPTNAADLRENRAVPSPSYLQPCGYCESCRLISSGNHPDFHLVYRQLIRLEKEDSKARELSALVIRDYLIAPANLCPSLSHGKVFVVEEAELMNSAAQNTLLKTLEEPPRDTFIILLTDQPSALLPTIRSRCQTVPFGVIDEKLLMAELKRRDVSDAQAAAFFAEGSLGHAIEFSAQGIIEQAEILRREMEQLVAGHGHCDIADWLKKSADAYADRQIKIDKLASKDQAMHDGLAIYLRLTSLVLRQMFKEQTSSDRLERLCQAIESIAETEINLQANVNVALALMNWEMAMRRELAAPNEPLAA